MTADKKNLMFSLFIKSQFTYFPLIWMFCTKHSVGRINSIDERCLCLMQQNYGSDFEVLLKNGNQKLVHQKCIELHMTEVYKYLNDHLLISWFIFSNSEEIPTIKKFSYIWILKSQNKNVWLRQHFI